MKKQIFKRAVSWLLAVGMTLSPSFTGLAAIPSFAEEGGITESVSEEAPETTETTDTEETQDGEQETALYTVAVSVNDTAMGTASASPDTDVEAGTEITLSYSANEGYEFVEWSVMPETVVITDNKFTMPEENVSVSAVFKAVETAPAVYAVAVNVNDTAMGTASASPDADVEAGTEITLSYSANEGYEFVEWSVMPETVVITDNKFTMPEENVSVSAVFKAVETVPVIEASETYIYTVTNGTDTSSFATMEEVKEWIDGKKDSDADYTITINSEEDVTVSGDSISFAYAKSVTFIAPKVNYQNVYIDNNVVFNYDVILTECHFNFLESCADVSCINNTITLNNGHLNYYYSTNKSNLNKVILNSGHIYINNNTISIDTIVSNGINNYVNVYCADVTIGNIEHNSSLPLFFSMDMYSNLTITGNITFSSSTTKFAFLLSGSSALADGTAIFKATDSTFSTENIYAVYNGNSTDTTTVEYDLYLENGEVKVKTRPNLFTVTNGTDTESFTSMDGVKEWIDEKADPDGEYTINYIGDANYVEFNSEDAAFEYAKSVAFNKTIYRFIGDAELNYDLSFDASCYFQADKLSIDKISVPNFFKCNFSVKELLINELHINVDSYIYQSEIFFLSDTLTAEIGTISSNDDLILKIPTSADVTISGKISLTDCKIILVPMNGNEETVVPDGTAILTVKDSSVTADMFASYVHTNDRLYEYTSYIDNGTVKLKEADKIFTVSNGTETKEFASMSAIKTYIDEKADSDAEYVITYTGSSSDIDIDGSDIEFSYAKSVTFKFHKTGFLVNNINIFAYESTNITYDMIFESVNVLIYDSFNCKNNKISLIDSKLNFDNSYSTKASSEIKAVSTIGESYYNNSAISILDPLHSVKISEINAYSQLAIFSDLSSLIIGDINIYDITDIELINELRIYFSEKSDIKITGKITEGENSVINLIGFCESNMTVVPDGITALTVTDSSVTADLFQSRYVALTDILYEKSKKESCVYNVYKEDNAIKLKRVAPLIVSDGTNSANVTTLTEATEWINSCNNTNGEYVIKGNANVLEKDVSSTGFGYDLVFNGKSVTFTSDVFNVTSNGKTFEQPYMYYDLSNPTFNCDVIVDKTYLYFEDDSDVSIDNLTLNDSSVVLYAQSTNSLKINEVTASDKSSITLTSKSKCTVGKVNGKLRIEYVNYSDSGSLNTLPENGTTVLTVEDSSVTADNFEIISGINDYTNYTTTYYQFTVYKEGNEIKIKDPVEYNPNEGGDEEDDTDDSVTVSDGDDTTGYETLEDALTAISKSTGDVTITLSENAEIKTLTLPARAKSVTIKGEGTLTIGNTSLTVPCNTVIENTLISNSAAPAAIKVSSGKTLTLNGTVQNFGTVSGTATSKLIVNTDTEFKALSTFGEVTVADGETLTVSGAVKGIALLNGALKLTNSASTAAITNIGSAELTLVETDGKLPKVTVTNVTDALMLTVENETGYLASGTAVLYSPNNITANVKISNTTAENNELTAYYYAKTKEIKAEVGTALRLSSYLNGKLVSEKNYPNFDLLFSDITDKNNEYHIQINEDITVGTNFTLPKTATFLLFVGEGTLTFTGTKLAIPVSTYINCPIAVNNRTGLIDISVAKDIEVHFGTKTNKNKQFINKLTGTKTSIFRGYATVNSISTFGKVNTDPLDDNCSITVNGGKASGINEFGGYLIMMGAKSTASIKTAVPNTKIDLVKDNGVIPKVTIENIGEKVEDDETITVTVLNSFDALDKAVIESGTVVLYTNKTDYTSKVVIGNNDEMKAYCYGKEIRAEYAEAILMNGEGYPNLEKAFEAITKAKDSSAEYVININEDVKSEKLALPKYAASITLRSDNANTINVGKLTSIAANTDLTIENIGFVTTGRSLTINAKKNLTVDGLYGNVTALKGGAKFALNWNDEDENTAKADITGFGTVNVSDKLTTGKNFNAAKLVLEDNAKLVMAASTAKASVKAITAGNASMIEFEADAIPLTFTGKDADLTAPTGLTITGEVVNGQAVIVSKNIILDKLNNFITPANENITYGFTRIGSNIFYMGNVLRVTGVDSANAFTEEYALWSEAIAAVSSKTADYTITLLDDYNANGAVKFPKAGTYNSLTIKSIDEAKNFNFTGSLSLTGKTVFENVNIGAVKNNAYTKYTINAGKNDLSIINCGLASVSAISGTGSMDLECVNVTGNVRAGNLRLSGRNTITNGLTATGLSFGENAELTMYNGSKLNVSKTGISGDNTLTLHIIDKLTGTHSALKAGTIISASFKGAYSNQILLDEQNGSFRIVLNGTKLVTK